MDGKSRRDVLGLGAAVFATGFAGCGSESSTAETDPSGPSERPTAATKSAAPTESPATTAGPSRAELRRRIARLEGRLEALKSTIEAKDGQLRSLRTDVATRNDRIATLENDLESLQETLDERTARVETLEATVDETEARIDELEERVESDSESDSDSDSEFSQSVRDRALSVGTAVRDAVVVVNGDEGGGGTGWFHESGHVITNSHVVDGQAPLTAWTLGGESFEPTVAGASDYMNSPYDDVAVLETDFSPPDTLSLGDSGSLEGDQPVVQVGHPGFVGNWVLSLGRFVKMGFGASVLTTVPSQSGNSGSPLVTLSGDVVGITTGSVARGRSGGGGEAPEPVAPTVNEEFPESTYATHDPASVVEQYIEDYG